jgi:hypothetical protein
MGHRVTRCKTFCSVVEQFSGGIARIATAAMATNGLRGPWRGRWAGTAHRPGSTDPYLLQCPLLLHRADRLRFPAELQGPHLLTGARTEVDDRGYLADWVPPFEDLGRIITPSYAVWKRAANGLIREVEPGFRYELHWPERLESSARTLASGPRLPFLNSGTRRTRRHAEDAEVSRFLSVLRRSPLLCVDAVDLRLPRRAPASLETDCWRYVS